jgi:hypothetical protein
VKSCGRTPEDTSFKMCARCRDTQAKQARKKRERKRERKIKDGTIMYPRAPIGVGFISLFRLSTYWLPIQPKPPLYRIPGDDKLYTERTWAHLDEELFECHPKLSPPSGRPSNTPSCSKKRRRDEPEGAKDSDTVELVEVKICPGRWCYQPIPVDRQQLCPSCLRLEETIIEYGRKRKRAKTRKREIKVLLDVIKNIPGACTSAPAHSAVDER